MKFPIHVRTLTGLEKILAEELSALGAQEIELRNRVVVCQGDLRLLYQANLWCRTAIRVLLPVGTFDAENENEFYDGIRGIDWSPWLKSHGTLTIDANVYSSFSTHSLYVAQLSKDAVVDQFREKTGARPSVNNDSPDLRIAVSLYRNHVEVFVDASGESLHKRGYRTEAGQAPLNEALAAGIIKLSGWDGSKPLLDPMCGSGTFAIEAALLLRNIAPGLFRKQFGFQRWGNFDSFLFDSLVTQARAAMKNVSVPIVGVDSDRKVINIAQQNARRAGVADTIRFETGEFLEWENNLSPGTLIMNPPYGERLGVADIAELYQQMGDRLKQHYAGWTAFILSGNAEAIKYIGLRTSQRVPLYNGPIECRLLKYELHAAKHALVRKAIDNPKWKERAEVFGNRLRKNFKHLAKKAKREGLHEWRLYDRDIPELPFAVDVTNQGVRLTEYPRHYDHKPIEHPKYVKLMAQTAAEVTGLPAIER